MHRIVHLDFKGAPLKTPYLEDVLSAAKSWGATGILLEWEDTFPYSNELRDIGSETNSSGEGMYTASQVRYILSFAKHIGLEAIQLIQTIGHLEFVLKHKQFSHLREEPRFPAVLCPSRPESLSLVCAMLQQALLMQPDLNYIHIGADEVWHTGVCAECRRRAESSPHPSAAYLQHVASVAGFLRAQRPDVTVLMWDDMLRNIPVDTINAYQLGSAVQPVVWAYGAELGVSLALWSRYRRAFPRLWAASAYKGANGSCQVISPVSRYASNHEAWVKEINNNAKDINFAGVILTGWSRYDHFATLCELMPAALPSLASCLKILTKQPDVPTESVVSSVLPACEWAGAALVAALVQHQQLLQAARHLLHGDMVATWLNPWQVEKRFTNPMQIEGIGATAQNLLQELSVLQVEVHRLLSEITGERSAEEWIGTNFTPIMKQLTEVRDTVAARIQADTET